MQPIKLIVGLGNPGKSYEHTRHNVGFWYVKALAESYGASFKKSRLADGEVATIHVGDHVCHLMMPLSYMNLSGTVVGHFVRYYRLPLNAVLVAQDDMDFAPGVVKLKQGGGAAGHNGISDITQKLGQADYYRLRFGIARPPAVQALESYVLSKPSAGDRSNIEQAIQRSLLYTEPLLRGEIAAVIQQLHTE